MESFFSFVLSLHPLTQFIAIILVIGGVFTSINYITGRLTIMFRGYPPPHCCREGVEMTGAAYEEDDE